MSTIGNAPPVKIEEKNVVSGTHNGKLTPEAKERRRAKNASNVSRAGNATRPRGSHRKPNPSGLSHR